MLTFEKILKLFQDYLQEESCIEIVHTKWGYVRLFCEAPYLDTIEAVICRMPEELFNELLDNYLMEQEYQLIKEHGLLSPKDQKRLEKMKKYFIEKASSLTNTL